tara:strand:- start:1089 stop:1388 length:300 start_codon:yes stop_codon:yes gene_type:complete
MMKTDRNTENKSTNNERMGSEGLRHSQIVNSPEPAYPDFEIRNFQYHVAWIIEFAKQLIGQICKEIYLREIDDEEAKLDNEQRIYMEYGYGYEFKYGNR